MIRCTWIPVTLLLAAYGSPANAYGADSTLHVARRTPKAVHRSLGQTIIGAPLAVALDFSGAVVVVDGSPGRLLLWSDDRESIEFDSPGTSGFYPTDVAVRGFFFYVIDESQRKLLRYDNKGNFRDVLMNFDQLAGNRRVTPAGLDVAETGRLAVTDIENHRVLMIDNYLELEIAFGNYGSFEGQLDSPQGVCFADDGTVVVADTGNGRVQVFNDRGTFLRAIPSGGAPGPLRKPRRIAVARDGRLFVADPEAGCVFVIDRDGAIVDAIAPEGVGRFEPTDVALTRDGLLYVTDLALRALYVFRVV